MSEPRALIPDPGGYRKYRSVQSITGLGDAEMHQVKESLVGLIAAHLDVSTTWTHQNPDALRRYTDDALRALPCLVRFENAWPARAVGQEILQRRTRYFGNNRPSVLIPRPTRTGKGWNTFRKVTSIPGMTCAERASLKETVPVAAKCCLDLTSHWTDQTRGAQKAYFASMTYRLPFLRRFEDAWPAEACIRPWLSNYRRINGGTLRPERRSRSASVQIVSTSFASSRPSSSSRAPQISNPAVVGIADLLASAYPGMNDELTSLLRRGGVTTIAHLNVLANLPQAEREIFIRDDLDSDLTPLQARLLRRFLEGMRDTD